MRYRYGGVVLWAWSDVWRDRRELARGERARVDADDDANDDDAGNNVDGSADAFVSSNTPADPSERGCGGEDILDMPIAGFPAPAEEEEYPEYSGYFPLELLGVRPQRRGK